MVQDAPNGRSPESTIDLAQDGLLLTSEFFRTLRLLD